MKIIFFFIAFSHFAQAAKIPVDIFDQSKLEGVLRNIPSAFVKSETLTGYVRKSYQFPKTKNDHFQISCQADYFGGAIIPSFKTCEVNVSGEKLRGDEYSFNMTDQETVSELNKAISYGETTKKFYATERVYGQSFEGPYRDLFRYSIICVSQRCDLTFTAKEAQ